MADKKVIINLAKKLKPKFSSKNPTQVYNDMRRNTNYKPILERITTKDFVYLVFLISNDSNVDLESLFSAIDFNLFGIEIGEIIENDPTVDCEECSGNGTVSCDYCGGDGEDTCSNCNGSGEQDCDYCGGDGVGEDEETCGNCDGNGVETCEYCDGDGYRNCYGCGGSGNMECSECEGSGTVLAEGFQEINVKHIMSYDANFREKYHNLTDEILEVGQIDRLLNTNLFLLINEIIEVKNDYVGEFEVKDEFLIKMSEDFVLSNLAFGNVINLKIN